LRKPIPQKSTQARCRAQAGAGRRPTTLVLAELAAVPVVPFALRPDRQARQRMAAELELVGLRRLRFVGALRAIGQGDWALQARLEATVRQACVVSLAPVVSRIEAAVRRRYLRALGEQPVPRDLEMPADTDTEPLPDCIDLEAVMLEALVLHVPLYPRAAQRAHDPSRFALAPAPDALAPEAHPFAALGGLRGRLFGQESE